MLGLSRAGANSLIADDFAQWRTAYLDTGRVKSDKLWGMLPSARFSRLTDSFRQDRAFTGTGLVGRLWSTPAGRYRPISPAYSSAGVGSGFGGSSRYGDEAEARRIEAPFSARVVEACRS